MAITRQFGKIQRSSLDRPIHHVGDACTCVTRREVKELNAKLDRFYEKQCEVQLQNKALINIVLRLLDNGAATESG